MEQFRAPGGGAQGLTLPTSPPAGDGKLACKLLQEKLGVLVGNPRSAQVCAVHTPNPSWLTSQAPGVKFAAQVL